MTVLWHYDKTSYDYRKVFVVKYYNANIES